MQQHQPQNRPSPKRYPLFFIATAQNRVLHQCSVPEGMPIRHAMAMAWDDFNQNRPGLSQKVQQGLMPVNLTAERDPVMKTNTPYGEF